MSPLLASLLHSLWIGLLCWAATRLALRALPAMAVEKRHATALIATSLLFIGWSLAWMIHRADAGPSGPSNNDQVESVSQPEPSAGSSSERVISVGDTAPPFAPAPQRPASVAERLAALHRAATMQTCLELLWLTGVACGLARLAGGLHVGGSRWLLQQPVCAVPSVWLDAWHGALENHARRLKTRLIAIERSGVPFVAGLLEPVIVVPLASCAGVSPELARAALAHELAHVARKDWLVEFGLRTVEAALFFNPFVWLLTAQVREEREACCDAWACRKSEIPHIKFAEALAAWARLLAPVAKPAEQGLGLGRGLLNRTSRLLHSPTTPRPRTWRGALGVLALAALGFAGYGGFLHWGASALRDAERIDLLDQAAAPYATVDPWIPPPKRESRPDRIITGRVVAADGTAVAGASVRFWAGDARSESSTKTGQDGSFKSSRPLSGPAEIRIWAEGYAMKKAYAEPHETDLPSAITLSKGVSIPVRVRDEAERPVPGVLVHWAIDVFGPRKADQALTDAEGLAWVKHLPTDIPVYIRAEGKGFATIGRGPLNAEELAGKTPVELRLPPGRAIKVRVVSEDDDTPVANAHLRIDSVQPPWSPGSNPHPSWNYGGLTTDHTGEAILSHLRADTTYRLQVGSTGSNAFNVLLAAAPAAEQVVRRPKNWPVTLQARGFPTQFRASPVVLWVEHDTTTRQHAFKLDENGNAQLQLTLPGKKPVSFVFKDPRLESLSLRSASPESLGKVVVFDYSTLPPEQRTGELRRVAIKFMHGGREFFPAGRFYIHRKASPYVWDADGFALEPGKPLFAEWADGTRLKLTADWGLTGAVIDIKSDGTTEEIVIDAQRTEIIVPVKPAGLVRAQVRDAKGNVVRDARLMGSTDHEIFSKRRRISFPGNISLGEWQASRPVEFSFLGTPVWGAHGLVFARGPSVSVSARKPVADVVVTLPKTRPYAFKVVDESGNTLSGVACKMTGRFLGKGAVSPPFGVVDRASEPGGHVRFDAGVDFTDWNELQLLVDAQSPGYARAGAAFKAYELKGVPVLTMKRAVAFRARIVNQITGNGVAGVEVALHDEAFARFTQYGRTLSDADGWIEFNDLAAGQKFRLSYGFPQALGLRLVQKTGGAMARALKELSPADTGLIVYVAPEEPRTAR